MPRKILINDEDIFVQILLIVQLINTNLLITTDSDTVIRHLSTISLVLFDSHFRHLFIHFIVSSVDLEDADGRLADNRGIDRIDFDFTKLSRTGTTATLLQTAVNATTTSLRIEARSPIRILLRQVFTLVLILAFGREATPVTVLALRNSSARLATLFCHEHNLVTTILQIDDSRL